MAEGQHAPGAPDSTEYARELKGVGINLLTSNVPKLVTFLRDIMGLGVAWADEDFAIVRHEGVEFMIHSDASYTENPLLSLTGDGTIRGAGLELRLYDVDPDHAARAAAQQDFHVLQEPVTKGHGLREAYIIGPDGYCWVPCKCVGMS